MEPLTGQAATEALAFYAAMGERDMRFDADRVGREIRQQPSSRHLRALTLLVKARRVARAAGARILTAVPSAPRRRRREHAQRTSGLDPGRPPRGDG